MNTKKFLIIGMLAFGLSSSVISASEGFKVTYNDTVLESSDKPAYTGRSTNDHYISVDSLKEMGFEMKYHQLTHTYTIEGYGKNIIVDMKNKTYTTENYKDEKDAFILIGEVDQVILEQEGKYYIPFPIVRDLLYAYTGEGTKIHYIFDDSYDKTTNMIQNYFAGIVVEDPTSNLTDSPIATKPYTTLPKVYLNGNKVFMQDTPFIQQSELYIPVRQMVTWMGETLKYDMNTKVLTLYKGEQQATQFLEDLFVTIEGEKYETDYPLQFKNGTLYAPISLIETFYQVGVTFDALSNSYDLEYDLDEQEHQLDYWGRIIRTDNPPKNSDAYSYLIEGIPNAMYEKAFMYDLAQWTGFQEGDKPEEFDGWCSPKNWYLGHVGANVDYSIVGVDRWKQIIESNLALRLNIDYKTVDDKWIDSLNQTYRNQKVGTMGIMTGDDVEGRRVDLSNYVKKLKANQITIEGDYYVEPTMLYNKGTQVMRTWVKFRVNAPKHIEKWSIYGMIEPNNTVQTNTWYEGYVDITLNYGSLQIGEYKSYSTDTKIFDDSLYTWTLKKGN